MPTISQLSHIQKKTQNQPNFKSINLIQQSTLSQKPETRGFKGGFIPAEMKSTGLNNGRDHQRGEKVYQTQDGTKDHPQKKGERKLSRCGHIRGTRRERSDSTKESRINQEKIKLPQNSFQRQTNNTNNHNR